MSKAFMLMPLTAARWKAAPDKPNVIIGEWAEDYGNTYEIIVPPQLRNSILIFQNMLCDRISEIETAKKFQEHAVKKLAGFTGE